MALKEYGVMGLLEWQAVLPAGEARVKVYFKGGSFSGYGITPAKFATRDKVIQSVIESSGYFKSGRIKLLKVDAEEAMAEAAAEEPKIESKSEAVASEGVMVFDSVDAAREYLVDLLGLSRTKLRTESAVMEAAKSAGLNIVIK